MQGWMKIAAAAAALPVTILLVLVFVFFNRCCSSERRRDFTDTRKVRAESFQSGIAEFPPLPYHANNNRKRSANYYVFQRGVSLKPLFSWADHPSFVLEAVEHGWSRFAFTGNMSSPSTPSMLLGLCASGDQGKEREVEISWEVCPTSADFMQKIRLNSGLKKINMGTHNFDAACVIKAALPLPGPQLGNSSSFPQTGYFEISILSSVEDDKVKPFGKEKKRKVEGDRTKLIPEIGGGIAQSDSLFHVTSIKGNNKVEEMKVGMSKEEGKGEAAVMLSVGFTGSGFLPSKLPGSYPGSIGLNSNGSVYLDGKLVFEADKANWGSMEKVIGCGFNPVEGLVFFTVNSELVHTIHCKSEEFRSPLYPTLAANIDATVLVNFGQSAFSFALANTQRTPNPCFISPFSNSPADALGFEDSQELFSMGRIDSQWLNRSTTKNNHNGDSIAVDVDEESETDLFEIILDKGSAYRLAQ